MSYYSIKSRTSNQFLFVKDQEKFLPTTLKDWEQIFNRTLKRDFKPKFWSMLDEDFLTELYSFKNLKYLKVAKNAILQILDELYNQRLFKNKLTAAELRK